jgi:DNA replication and repair protein RecF
VRINRLSLYNFKNHSELKLDFTADITGIIGNNGKGKTNVLDAIYLLSTCKSYFNAIDYQLIRHGETLCAVNAQFSDQQQTDLQLAIEQGKKKKLKRNDKQYDKLIDHIGMINVVMITPDDVELVTGHSDVRRKFIDICISQTDREYLNNLSEYQKVLEQRNKQLKLFAQHRHFDEIIIESYDAKLVPAGNYIYNKRAEVLGKLNQYFNEIYPAFSSGEEIVTFKYESDLHTRDFAAALKEEINRDLAAERTTIGIHKDDIQFEINGYPLKRFGSQGQSKSFIVALKLAQYRFLSETLDTLPILLLDDMFEKIDEVRAQRLINMLGSDQFGQIVLTDTHIERVRKHFENVNKSINFVEL